MEFEKEVNEFLFEAMRQNLNMLMVGGGAVNFHGYRRHSADVDFWIEPTKANFDKLLWVLQKLGYDIEQLPPAVLQQEQNVSINISPEQDLELITNFNPGKSFDACLKNAPEASLSYQGKEVFYKVLGFEELIDSKVKSGRPKDLLDIQELQRIKNGSS